MSKNGNMPPEETMSPEEWESFVAETNSWREKFTKGSVYDSQKALATLAGTVIASTEIIIGKARSNGEIKPYILACQKLTRTLPPRT